MTSTAIRTWTVSAVVAMLSAAPETGLAGLSASGKNEVVSVMGCVKASGDSWLLVQATAPTPATDGVKPAPKTPTFGGNQFKLVGVTPFNLPSRNGQAVIAQGLVVKTRGEALFNVTSILTIAETCQPSATRK